MKFNLDDLVTMHLAVMFEDEDEFEDFCAEVQSLDLNYVHDGLDFEPSYAYVFGYSGNRYVQRGSVNFLRREGYDVISYMELCSASIQSYDIPSILCLVS